MKKITIQSAMFNKALETVKGTLAQDDTRPVLKFVKVEVEEKTIRFVSVNGYSLTTHEFEHCKEDVTPFEFLMKPFKVDVDKYLLFEVDVEMIDNDQKIQFSYKDLEDSKLVKVVKNFLGEYINYKNIIQGNESTEFVKIAFDKRLLLDSLKSHNDRFIILNVPTSTQYMGASTSMKPIFINSKNEFGKTKSMVLPSRLFDEIRK